VASPTRTAVVRRTLAVVLTAVLGVALLAATTPSSADEPSCQVSTILVDPCRPWLGASTANYPAGGSGTTAQVLYHEQRIGRQLDIVHTYHPVGTNSLTPDDVYFATRPDTMLYANWKPSASWADIASQNAAIDQMAASIKSVSPNRIFLTLWHEPEKSVSPGGDPNCPGVNYKGGAGTVADYRAMWQYVENRFAADGVNNVVWVLNYMNFPNWDCLIPDLYPGDQYVDWITFNAYQQTASQTFSQNVSHFTQLLTSDTDATHSFTSKPWGIAEWGTHGFTTAQEAAFYDSAKAALDSGDPALGNIHMYMAFDENDQASQSGDNYRVGYDDNGTLDPAKGAHYYAFADDPLLAGGYSPPAPPPDNTPPTATLTSPADQDTVQGSVPVTGTVADDRHVAAVQLLVDGAAAGAPVADPPSNVEIDWDSTGVANGTHTLQLQATDSSGNASTSAQIGVTVDNPDAQPPSVPADVTADPNGGHEVDVSWDASSDNVGVTGYDVYREGTLVGSVDGNTTSYDDTGLDDATTYHYTVDAFDAAGNTSAQSDPATATTADVTAPVDPGGLSATATDPHDVSLSWDASADNVGVTGYDVYRDGSLLGEVSDPGYRDSGLADGSSHTYAVVALDAAGNTSPGDDSATLTLPDVTAPDRPTGVQATALSGSSIELDWQPADDNVGVAGYDVYRDGTFLAVVTGATSYVDTDLVDATTYTYSVDAFDAAANVGRQSDSATATTPDVTVPTAPSHLAAKALDYETVNLTWRGSTDNVGVAYYVLYRNGAYLATTDPTTTTYRDQTAASHTQYHYTVVAMDGAGNVSLSSNVATLTTPDGTPPTAPPTLTARLSSSSVVLRWGASTDNVKVTGYAVLRDGVQIATTTPGVRTYTDTAAAQAATHSYTVEAVDAAGNQSPDSPTASLTVPDRTPPSQPTGLVLTSGHRSITLAWTASTDNVAVKSYQVYRDGVRIATVGSGTTLVNRGLVTGAAYAYDVVAIDTAGNRSASSDTASASAA
jgi:chitodextrinase